MGDKRDSIWNRWDRNKLCAIDNNIDTNMYNSKLRISKNNDTTIFNNDVRDRSDIDRGVYGNGYIRILCII